jgi:putative tryptophan/tyrosine transport system substrate-binding protein
MLDLRRRQFMTLLGGAAAAWPLAARAQQEGMRRVGVLTSLAEDHSQMKLRVAAFREGLEKLGWSEGRNVRIDYRFASAPNPDQARVLAKQLIALRPDVIVAQSTPVTAAFQQEGGAIPVVFIYVNDPIGSGFVASLARPAGNLTGFMLFESAVAGKWLAMLKEIAPRVERAAFLINPKTSSFANYLREAETPAQSLAIELVPRIVQTAAEIESTIEAFARVPDGGLVLAPDATLVTHGDLIINLAARHRLPAVYPYRHFTVAGGLVSYGIDYVEPCRQAATYVNRILRGDKPANLPVQAPTKYETVINLKTAKALGLEVPPALLAIADEMIE